MPVQLERHDEVFVATIDDGKANALSVEVVSMLRDAVATAAEHRCPLVIAGRAGAFSAGFDLKVVTGPDTAAAAALFDGGGKLYHEMLAAPVPMVAACTGHALAGGALILLAADFRIGVPHPCKIGLNEVRIGLALPKFAVVLARHRLATRYLTTATLSAEVGDPARACEVGFLDELREDAVQASIALARDLASLSSKAFAVTKKRLWGALLADLAGGQLG